MDSSNLQIDNMMKYVLDIKNCLQFSQKDSDELNKTLSDHAASLKDISSEFASLQSSFDKPFYNIIIDGVPEKRS